MPGMREGTSLRGARAAEDLEFRLCLQYWLGLQIFEEDQRCPVCLSVADHFGDHHVGCGGNARAAEKTASRKELCRKILSGGGGLRWTKEQH